MPPRHHLREATRRPRSAALLAAAAFALLGLSASLPAIAQPAQHIPARPDPLSRTPQQWIDAAAAHEVPMIQYDLPYLRFHMLYKGEKGLELRDEIESRDGMVARVISKNGRPLTPAEDAAERDRLQHLLENPSEFYNHHKHDQQDKNHAAMLVKLLPRAMLFTYAADQTPAPNDSGPQVVLDYKPNPAFKPPSMESEALQGISGRIWIDTASEHMVRMHADVISDVSFGWGLVGRLYRGGKLDLDQTDAGPRWMFQRLNEQVSARVVIVKVNTNVQLEENGYSTVPAMGFQDAIRILLNTPLPAQCPCN
ncbi:MAG TPA: hypothetical protein VNU94_08510 [Acidobacteriaceae bacterium]|jgi:hypothetical protein|nr:hypothetical protein [Acidobacteriaceae bacterium]